MACSVDESYRHCQALARRTARNFYYSFLTLPRDRRRAMCALYAFMRVTDDLGDSDRPVAEKADDLAHWRRSLHSACTTGQSEHPVLPALADTVRQYHLPVRFLSDVITGVEMDLQPVAIDTRARLADYCYHVAGAVGLACIHLWGFHDERAIPAAIDCGMAFQMTNILRDLAEDAARGRVYIPREDLAQFGLSAADLGSGQTEGFRQLMEFEVARTREYYARARALFDYLDPPGQPILETMLRIYGGLLDEIERRKYDVFTRRVELSRSRKLLIVADVLVRSKLRKLVGRG
jgi:15-cis-phytoene synthase